MFSVPYAFTKPLQQVERFSIAEATGDG